MVSIQELEEKLMDPSQQDEELRRLSQRTEELLSRLDTLSQSLNDQLENHPAGFIASQSQGSEYIHHPVLAPRPHSPAIPINRQYLEKQEHSYTVPSGQSYMTTKKTAIITEQQQHYPQSAGVQSPQQPNDFVTARFDGYNFQPGASPPASDFATGAPNFAPPPDHSAIYGAQPRDYAEPNTTAQPPLHSEPLRPAAVFSQSGPYVNVTRRHTPSDLPRTQARPLEPNIPDFMAPPVERAPAYTTRFRPGGVFQVNDLLKWFALAVPFFALAVPLAVIKGNPPMTIAFSCISFFFGLFFSFVAYRLIDITSQVKWANAQIIEINEKLSHH